MRRPLVFVGLCAAALLLVAPAALAETGLTHTGRVLISVGGDVRIPSGEHADAVIVVNGTANVAGEVGSLVVVDGTAQLAGGTVETVVAVRGVVELGAGSLVLGDVRTLDATVDRAGTAVVQGSVRGLEADLLGIGLVLGPALLLLYLGATLAIVIAAMALAGLAARQVRLAEALISHDPGTTFLVGLVGAVLVPLAAVLLMITVIGAPLGVGVLLGALPLAALLGYLVAGIWIGDWLLGRVSHGGPEVRPYRAAIVGVLILQVLGVIPALAALASLFGLGAVLLFAWRTLRGHEAAAPAASTPAAMPMGG